MTPRIFLYIFLGLCIWFLITFSIFFIKLLKKIISNYSSYLVNKWAKFIFSFLLVLLITYIAYKKFFFSIVYDQASFYITCIAIFYLVVCAYILLDRVVKGLFTFSSVDAAVVISITLASLYLIGLLNIGRNIRYQRVNTPNLLDLLDKGGAVAYEYITSLPTEDLALNIIITIIIARWIFKLLKKAISEIFSM